MEVLESFVYSGLAVFMWFVCGNVYKLVKK